MNIILNLLMTSIRYGTALLFGTTGEIMTQKSGSLNLGVEGVMAVGAIGGMLAACATNSLFIGIVCAFLCGSLCGLLFSFLTVTLQANQNVTGLAISIFGLGVCRFIGQSLQTAGKFPQMSTNLVSAVADNGIPLLRDIPILGDLLFSHNIFVYLGIVIAVLVGIYMNKTKAGLRLRAIGESPAAADGVGVNITQKKYINIMIGTGIEGIGGLYMASVFSFGQWSDNWINGYGWIAIALVIFANWSSVRAIAGSYVFGFLLMLGARSAGLATTFPAIFGWMSHVPTHIYNMLPFLITALVLIITSMRKNKRTGEPASCGINYYREDR